MIGRIEAWLRAVHRKFSRSELAVRLLGLPVSRGDASRPGLVLIQIDGLSHSQFRHALERGRMPFVKRLLARERYRLHVHYSGMPSTTPAVQGELFFGVRGAVPAFSFRDRTGDVVRMYEPDAAIQVEQELAAEGRPLLKDGSAYLNIYSGGAKEFHFCPASLGWGEVLKGANPLALAFLVISNAYSFVRTAVLVVLEVFLATTDCIRGIVGGRSLSAELKFVPSRVGISILLRELVTIGAKVDVARGLPVIHANFLGYDEQAHRRGPNSRFAHWALKGIDDAVARIWRAAHLSARRHYEVWIYSDHGQEEVVPYPHRNGRTIHEAVAEVFGQVVKVPPSVGENRGIQFQRLHLLGNKHASRWLVPEPGDGNGKLGQSLHVVAMGPVGLIYVDGDLTDKRREQLAQALVASADLPLVLTADGSGGARAYTERGAFVLPRDAAGVLGEDHPFLEETARDLVALCHHPNAGTFVFSGWRQGGPSYSFPNENGAHAGPGPEETRAFAVLPEDTPLVVPAKGYLRPDDLRRAAFRVLERPVIRSSRVDGRDVTARGTLRVMTYNVHHCVGMDGRHAPERIARVIARHRPDVVALQELDVGRLRTGGIDQAHRIAHLLEMQFHFHPAIHVAEERYGDAVLTHLPMRLVRADHLPGPPPKLGIEPRGAVWVAIRTGETELQLINTHLGLRERERRVQVEALLGRDWLGHPDCRAPVILCGDLNALPRTAAYRRIQEQLSDAQECTPDRRTRGTMPGRYPMARIDHIFFHPEMEVISVEVPDGHLERVASDHLPVIAELRIPEPAVHGSEGTLREAGATAP